jgi:hypothetical protein
LNQLPLTEINHSFATRAHLSLWSPELSRWPVRPAEKLDGDVVTALDTEVGFTDKLRINGETRRGQFAANFRLRRLPGS